MHKRRNGWNANRKIPYRSDMNITSFFCIYILYIPMPTEEWNEIVNSNWNWPNWQYFFVWFVHFDTSDFRMHHINTISLTNETITAPKTYRNEYTSLYESRNEKEITKEKSLNDFQRTNKWKATLERCASLNTVILYDFIFV